MFWPCIHSILVMFHVYLKRNVCFTIVGCSVQWTQYLSGWKHLSSLLCSYWFYVYLFLDNWERSWEISNYSYWFLYFSIEFSIYSLLRLWYWVHAHLGLLCLLDELIDQPSRSGEKSFQNKIGLFKSTSRWWWGGILF